MTAEQLFLSPAQIISSLLAVVCAATLFQPLFATKRKAAQNRVALRDTDNLQMSAIQTEMDTSNGRPGGYGHLMGYAHRKIK